MGDFTKRLKEMEDTWEENSARAGADIVDGKWMCKLQKAELREAGADDNVFFVIEWLVYDGESAGETASMWFNLESEWGPSFLKQTLTKLDVEFPSSPTELEETAETLTDNAQAALIRFSTKGDYQNSRIVRLLEDDELPEEPEAEDEEYEDEEEEDEDEDDEDEDEDDAEEEEDEDEDDEDEDDEDEEDEEAGDADEEIIESLAGTFGVDFDEDDEWDDVLAALQKAAKKKPFDRTKMSDEEIEFASDNGIKLSAEKKERKKKTKKLTEKQLVAKLQAIADAWEIDLGRTKTLKGIQAKLADLEFEKGEMDDDEVAAAEQAGLTLVD